MRPGASMPVHHVQCPCGTALALKTYWREPRCRRCRDRAMRGRDLAQRARQRQEARRFRIVCHVLGYEPDQFADMLEEMKRSPMAFRTRPEERAAKIDWQHEQLFLRRPSAPRVGAPGGIICPKDPKRNSGGHAGVRR